MKRSKTRGRQKRKKAEPAKRVTETVQSYNWLLVSFMPFEAVFVPVFLFRFRSCYPQISQITQILGRRFFNLRNLRMGDEEEGAMRRWAGEIIES